MTTQGLGPLVTSALAFAYIVHVYAINIKISCLDKVTAVLLLVYNNYIILLVIFHVLSSSDFS